MEKFKKYFRTPEVHGNSELPDRLLRLEKPSHEENNQPLRLINILSAMWNPLLEILNDMKPSTTAGSGTSPEFGLEWLKAIQENNLEVINKELDRIKQVMIGKSNN
ncbi:MAG: hypothetical protein KGQ36_00590 [Rickettsiales bacterium]|nr:hypothetical protein [Rickettsiales bacterium]